MSLEHKMKSSFESTQDWCQTYQNLYDAKALEFNALFVYELIRQKASLKSFERVLPVLKDPQNTYSQFFHTSEGALSAYLKHDRYNNVLSPWQNINNIFHDKKGLKHTLCESTKDYLFLMIKHMPQEAMSDVFYDFLDIFKENIKELKPLAKMAQVSSCKEEINKHLLNMLSRNSLAIQDNARTYEMFNEVIDDFPDLCEKHLFQRQGKSSEEPNFSVLTFLHDARCDVVSMLHKKYLQNIQNIKPGARILQNEQLNDYYELEPYINKIINFSPVMSTSLENKSFPIDYSLLDTDAKLYKNFIILKALSLQTPLEEVPPEVCQYIKAQAHKYKKSPPFQSILDLDILDEKMLPFNLEASLDKKSDKKKMKI